MNSTEHYSKVFIVGANQAHASGTQTYEFSRKCLICEQVFSRQGSCEHSKIICYPPASAAN
jgi:hypothetical protein